MLFIVCVLVPSISTSLHAYFCTQDIYLSIKFLLLYIVEVVVYLHVYMKLDRLPRMEHHQ